MTLPVYITPDDFKNEYGIDLREALRNDDGVSDRAESFIASVTSHLKAWIDYSSFRRVRFDCLTDFQLEYFKKALLAQVYYTFKEGLKALGLSSGVDDEKGVIISPDVMAQVEICPAAVEYLSVMGIFNLTMKNRPRVSREVLIGTGMINPSIPPQQPKPEPPQPEPDDEKIGLLCGIGYEEV